VSESPTRLNWPLLLGAILLALILALAIFGPALAPNDPREQKLIIQVNGKWLKPPYPAFTPGYPLGSDDLGRDLWSWLLWAVRPTLILGWGGAAIRGPWGGRRGGGAGWSDGWGGRGCDALIAAALSAPALLAALLIITAVGFQLGVWAFVVGLAVTGWAETAQLVREQTRTIKGQEAVEAARALGASGAQIFFLHILPQIMPMIWMLLAFEISSTLVTTAGLGFLGYYLGGAVFTEVDDFVYQRISEMPELGQMLATAWMVLDEPWAMVAAGTVVFLIVLAFNLLGEGLQQRLTHKLGGARGFYTWMAGEVLPRWDQTVATPVGNLIQRRGVRPLLGLLLLALVVGGVLRGYPGGLPHSAGTPTPDVTAATAPAEATPTALPVSPLLPPGGHLWPAERHDPWGTLWTAAAGPQQPTTAWTFAADAGFSGGPVVAADGTLYAVTVGGTLYALDPAGAVRWQTALVTTAVGSPALSAAGDVYVVDALGGLATFTPQGELRWRVQPSNVGRAHAGPGVAPDGVAYYLFSRQGKIILQAVTADGALSWTTALEFAVESRPPALDPTGTMVFWKTWAARVSDGALIPNAFADQVQFSPHNQVLVGADGAFYLRAQTTLFHLTQSPAVGLTLNGVATTWVLTATRQVPEPRDGGVTPDGIGWIFGKASFGGGAHVVWGAVNTPEAAPATGIVLPYLNQARVLAVDRAATLYLCGMDNEGVRCYAVAPEQPAPVWEKSLPDSDLVVGGALAPGVLYLATRDGQLYALGE